MAGLNVNAILRDPLLTDKVSISLFDFVNNKGVMEEMQVSDFDLIMSCQTLSGDDKALLPERVDLKSYMTTYAKNVLVGDKVYRLIGLNVAGFKGNWRLKSILEDFGNFGEGYQKCLWVKEDSK